LISATHRVAQTWPPRGLDPQGDGYAQGNEQKKNQARRITMDNNGQMH